MGDWLVWGGLNTSNRAPFDINRRPSVRRDHRRPEQHAARLRGEDVSVEPEQLRQPWPVVDPNNIPRLGRPVHRRSPSTPPGCTLGLTGHTEWVDGAVHETGFTTAWTPNKQIIRTSPPSQSLDLVNWRENAVLTNGGPSLAAITSRSYHPGGVNALFGDGSVRFIKDSDQRGRVAVARDHRRRRGHLVGPALTSRRPLIGRGHE